MIDLAEHVAETLDVGPGTRVFEVDCGDGAFLFPLHQNNYIVGGIDADAEAIKHAIAEMPGGVFQVGAASALDPAAPWDVVIWRFRDQQRDLRGVLARMFAKATHAIALLDVPEPRRQWMMHALTEIGANTIQFETTVRGFHVFARV